MMYGTSSGMGVWGLVMLLGMIAVLALAVVGGVWLYRRPRDEHRVSGTAHVTDGSPMTSDAAQNRLRERYAAGEIDDEEYATRLSALTHWR